jgi:hypothetical protein
MIQPHTHALSAPPLVWSDYVFLAILIINLATVLLLGRDIFIQGDKLEQARKNGELVMAWAAEIDENFEAGKPIDPLSCKPTSESDLKKPNVSVNTFGDCLSALFGTGGKFSNLQNSFIKDGLIWAKKCDREHPQSKGALVFERVTSGPTGSPVVSELKESDPLQVGMEFRVNACDRGFYLIKIGDVKL